MHRRTRATRRNRKWLAPERRTSARGVILPDQHAPVGRNWRSVGQLLGHGRGPARRDRNASPQGHFLRVVERTHRNENPGRVLQPRLVVASFSRSGRPVSESSIRQPEPVHGSDAQPCAPSASGLPETSIATCNGAGALAPAVAITARARWRPPWRSRQRPQRRPKAVASPPTASPGDGRRAPASGRRGPAFAVGSQRARPRLDRDRVDEAVPAPGAGLGPGHGRPEQLTQLRPSAHTPARSANRQSHLPHSKSVSPVIANGHDVPSLTPSYVDQPRSGFSRPRSHPPTKRKSSTPAPRAGDSATISNASKVGHFKRPRWRQRKRPLRTARAKRTQNPTRTPAEPCPDTTHAVADGESKAHGESLPSCPISSASLPQSARLLLSSRRPSARYRVGDEAHVRVCSRSPLREMVVSRGHNERPVTADPTSGGLATRRAAGRGHG